MKIFYYNVYPVIIKLFENSIGNNGILCIGDAYEKN